MNRRRLLQRIMNGHTNNIRFGDFVDLIEGFGFEEDRVRGSHRQYRHPIGPKLNIQPQRGEAKPYQVKDFIGIVTRYDLHLEGE